MTEELSEFEDEVESSVTADYLVCTDVPAVWSQLVRQISELEEMIAEAIHEDDGAALSNVARLQRLLVGTRRRLRLRVA